MSGWLLLRGLGRDKRHWGEFPKLMEKAMPEDKVYCIDLPGITGVGPVPTSVQGMVDQVRDEWLELKPKHESWNLVAISLGGMLAIDWCFRNPNDFKHLVVINSSSKTTSNLFERVTPAAIKTILKAMAMKDTRERERKILEITTNLVSIDDQILDEWVEIAESMKISKMSLVKQLLAGSKFKLPKKLQTPLTVLASRADKFVDYSCSQGIARRFNAPLHLHETAGHDLPMDDPNWVIKALQDI